MISELLKQLMQACGLKQKDLADVLGMPLQRVKHLTAGNVQKLATDETRRLVQTLNLNAHWLATGTGEMFNPMGGEQLGTVLTQLKLSSSRVEQLGLPDEDAIAARDIAMGVGSGNSAVVMSAIQRLRQIPPADEQLLVDTYRRCTPAAKANLIQTAALLSVAMDAPTQTASASASGNNNQVNSGQGAVQIKGTDSSGKHVVINTGRGSVTTAKVSKSFLGLAIGKAGRKKTD